MLARWNVATAAVVLGLLTLSAFADPPTLRDVYHDDFVIGVALGGMLPDSYPPAEIQTIVQQFDGVTPENCLKPISVHPQEGVWTFEQADALVQFAQQNHMSIHGHTLVWHNQTPNWFFEDGGNPAPREKVLERLRQHIQTVVGRYKGKIYSWDVVNEAIADEPQNYLRKTKWFAALGDDYIEQAFRMAHEADPDAKLQYNDYNIETGAKHQNALKLLRGLVTHGVPIDSVGIQGHWLLDHVPFDDIERAINDFHSLGLKVNFTEVDLDVIPRHTRGAEVTARDSSHPAQALSGAALDDVLKRQADQYAQVFQIFLKHKDAIERVTFWGADDGHSWLNTWPSRRENYALLFDRQFQPKPAFFAIIGVVAPASASGH